MSDPFTTRSQNLIRRSSLAIGILGTISMVLRLSAADMAPNTLLIGCTVIAIYYLIYFLPKNKPVSNLTIYLFTATNFFGVFAVVYFASGLNAPIAMLLPAIVIMGFLTLNNRASFVLCCMTILTVLLLAVLEVTGHKFPENPLTPSGIVFMRAVWLMFAIVVAAFTIYYFRKQNKLLENQLYEISITDHLTNLYNRRYFDSFIHDEFARNKRNQTSLAIILIDIDFFKSYNDTYGHQAGDTCLVEIAKLLQDNFKRSVDRIVRYGGEEFIVVLPKTELEQAYDLAEIFRRQVKDLNLLHSASHHKIITVSIGVHAIDGKDKNELKALIQGADQAMYQSKQRGRNKTTSYTDNINELADNR